MNIAPCLAILALREYFTWSKNKESSWLKLFEQTKAENFKRSHFFHFHASNFPIIKLIMGKVVIPTINQAWLEVFKYFTHFTLKNVLQHF